MVVMEIKPIIKFEVNLTDNIWLCQSIPGKAHEYTIQSVVIIFAHRYCGNDITLEIVTGINNIFTSSLDLNR